jgi:tRNA wybutosine-synthesizing protein 4
MKIQGEPNTERAILFILLLNSIAVVKMASMHSKNNSNTDITQPEQDACVRSTAADAILSKCSAVNKGYFDDPYVHFFAPTKGVKRAPLINRGYYARFKAVDTIIRRFLSVQNGQKKHQIVVLGAGVDTLFFRLATGDANSNNNNITIFDLDFEQVCKKKIDIVRKTKELAELAKENPNFVNELKEGQSDAAAIGTHGEHDNYNNATEFHGKNYHIVPADLRNIDLVEKQLIRCGIDFNVPTLFLSECVLIYMHHEHSNDVIKFAGKKFPTSVFVTYEQILPNTRFGSVMVNNIKRRGCPLQSIHQYPNCISLKNRYEKLGYRMANVLDMNQVYYQYLDPKDVSRIQRLELFDELEEWHLIQGHYSIAVAINDLVDCHNSTELYDDEQNLKPKVKEIRGDNHIIKNAIGFALKDVKVPSFFNKYVD